MTSTYLKGPALLALARQKARELDIESERVKLAELICMIQQREGHTACFRARKSCAEFCCCWQASCGAEMQKNQA